MLLNLSLPNRLVLLICVGVIRLIAAACGSAAGEADLIGQQSVLADEYTAAFEALTPSGARSIDLNRYSESTDVDNIAPIYEPLTVSASDVDLLATELVIGVEINGEARAHPHRLMQFREMANDVVGGVDLPQIVVPVAMLVPDASFEVSTRHRDVACQARPWQLVPEVDSPTNCAAGSGCTSPSTPL